MRSLRDERGGVAVIAALAMTVLTGMVAFVADFGAGTTEELELQGAVDAAALAVAQSCAVASAGCNATAATATVQQFLDDAVSVGTGRIDQIAVDLAARQVTVAASGLDGDGVPVGVGASAVAAWEAPAVVNFCDYAGAVDGTTTGTVVVTYYAGGADPSKICENNGKKGADDWVDEFFDYASADILCGLRWAAMFDVDWPCTEAKLRSYVGQELLVPTFTVRHNGKWDLSGFERAVLTGYRVGPGWSWPLSAPPCTGAFRCIAAVFGGGSNTLAAKARLVH